jgi:hypothetical protein
MTIFYELEISTAGHYEPEIQYTRSLRNHILSLRNHSQSLRI